MPTRTFPLDRPLDLALTLGPHSRGPRDPTMRMGPLGVIRATRTPEGPATISLAVRGTALEIEAYGPGADAALQRVATLVGLDEDRRGFVPREPWLRELDRRLAGLRIGRSGAVLEALVPAILEQKVTSMVAWRGFRGLIDRYGEAAPGPFGLRLLPSPAAMAAISYMDFHPIGIERRRAELIRTVARHAARFEEVVALPLADAYARLTALPGLGPWTAAEVAIRALGDPDAVSLGDYHLPNVVSYAFTGERRGTDERMLELLEPYRPQRGRVIRLIEAGHARPGRRGPRMSVRSIASI
jgi:3-methyladenine DNA glycosylase/8-oxoguanine DNA glycosylase